MGPLLIGDRPLPHHADTEAAALSCLMSFPGDCVRDIERIRPDDFYIPSHRRIFEAIKHLAATRNPEGIDLIAISRRLQELDMLEDIGGPDNLRQIANRMPHAMQFDQHADTIRNYGRMRRLINTATDIAGKAFEATEEFYRQTLESAETEILKICTESDGERAKYIRDYTTAAIDASLGEYALDPQYLGFRTGFIELNNIIEGIKPREMFVLAARPSLGKTTLAVNLCKNLCILGSATEKTPVGFYSFEVGALSLTQKFLYMMSGSSLKTMRANGTSTAFVTNALTEAKLILDQMPIVLDEKRGTYEDLKHRIRKDVRRAGVKIAFIDYLQLISMDKPPMQRDREVALMSKGIKNLAEELNIPIIILAQLNRGAEGNKPGLANLRESGAIEQDADVIGLLDRDRETDNQETQESADNGQGIHTKLIIAKNRNGATGVANLIFHPSRSQFTGQQRYNDSSIN